jgi:hypothetical protein
VRVFYILPYVVLGCRKPNASPQIAEKAKSGDTRLDIILISENVKYFYKPITDNPGLETQTQLT